MAFKKLKVHPFQKFWFSDVNLEVHPYSPGGTCHMPDSGGAAPHMSGYLTGEAAQKARLGSATDTLVIGRHCMTECV